MKVVDLLWPEQVELVYKEAESLACSKSDLPLELKMALFEVGLACRKVEIELLKMGVNSAGNSQGLDKRTSGR